MEHSQFPLNPLAVSIMLALSAPSVGYALDTPTPIMSNSSLTITDPVIVTAADGSIIINNANNNTQITSQVTGVGTLVKQGTGTLTLTATNNSYSGGTTIQQGTLAISADGSLGTGMVIIDDGSTLQTNNNLNLSKDVALSGASGIVNTNGNNAVINRTVSGVGQLTKEGEGSLTLTGNNTYLGGTVVDKGNLIITKDANLGAASSNLTLNAGTLQTNANLTLKRDIVTNTNSGGGINTSGNDVVLDGSISGTGPLVKLGAGKLTLTKNNGFSNLTAIYGGTLSVSDDLQLGTGSNILVDGGTLETTADVNTAKGISVGLGSLTVETTGSDNDTLISGVISGAAGAGGGLIKSGEGALKLTATNTYLGKTVVERGTLLLTDTTNIGNAAGGVSLAGGDVKFEKAFVLTGALELQGAGGSIDTSGNVSTVSGQISGSGNLEKRGSGILVLSNGANTHTGSTIITGGVLQVGSDQVMGSGGSIVLNGGTLQTSADITSSRAVQITSANGTIDTSTHTDTLSGNISGAGQLVKSGTGTLSLSGNNSFQGGVKVKSGTLEVNSDQALGSANAEVIIDGATLGITGSTSVNRNVSLTDHGGTLAVVSGATADFVGAIVGSAAPTSDLIKSGGGVLNLSAKNSAFKGDITVKGGALGVKSAADLGVGRLTLDGGSLRTNADLDFNRALVINSQGGGVDTNDKNSIVSGVISGSGKFIKSGAGSLELKNVNLYSGGTEIQQGELAVTTHQNLVSGGTAVILNGGDLKLLTPLDFSDLAEEHSLVLGANGGGLNTNGNNSTINSVLVGSGVLTKKGTGTLTLSQTGANLLTGGITVKGGNLSIDRDESLGTAPAILTLDTLDILDDAGAVLQTTVGVLQTTADIELKHAISTGAVGGTIETMGHTVTAANVVSGAGKLTQNGIGTLILQGQNTYQGGTSVTAGGVLSIESDANLGNATGGLSIDASTLVTTGTVTSRRQVSLGAGGATLSAGGNTVTLNGAVTGVGDLTANNATLILNGANTQTGNTTINDGSLTVGTSGALGSNAASHLTLKNSALVAGADVSLQQQVDLGASVVVDTQQNQLALTGVVAGNNDLVKKGTGTLKLSGVNTFSGNTIVNEGTLEIKNESSLGASNNITLKAATLKTDENTLLAASQNLTLTGGGTVDVSTGTTTVDAKIGGTGGLTKAGAGSLVMTANNDYAGNTVITAGSVGITSNSNLGDAANNIQLSGGALQTLADMTIDQFVIVNAAGGTIDTVNHNSVINNVISGTGALSKVGTGSLTLSGVNTYSGGTQVNAGTVAISNDNNLGDAAGVLSVSNATVQTTANVVSGRAVNVSGVAVIDSQANADTLSGIISGTGALSKVGTGSLTLSGVNTYSGGTQVNAGTVAISNDNNLGDAAGVLSVSNATVQTTANVVSGRAVNVSGVAVIDSQANADTLSGIISGTGALSKVGTGSLTLSGVNTYSGGTQVNAGTVAISNDNNLGDAAGVLSVSNATVQTTANVVSGRAVNVSGVAVIDSQANADTLSGIISGTGALSKVGTGSLTLSGVNTYSGGTQVNAGTVAISNDNNLGDAAGVLSVSNATVQTTANVVSGRAVNVSGVAVIDSQANADTLSGIISGTGALSKVGTGSLTLKGVNTYSGNTLVNSGSVIVSDNSSLGVNNNVVFQAGTSLKTASAVTLTQGITLAGNTLVDTGVNLSTLSGIISGTGALSKVGTGSLTLSGVNTYKGGTQVNAGTVAISNDNNLGDAAGVLSVSNATVQTTANVVSGRAVNVSGVAVIDSQANADTLSGIISGTGALSKVGTGSLTLSGVNTYSGGTQVNAGTVAISNDNNLGDAAGVLSVSNATVQTTANVVSGRAVNVSGVAVIDSQANADTLSGIISGTGALSKVGTGSLTLSGVNTYSGGTQVNAGTVAISNDNNLGDAAGVLSVSNATVQTTANVVSGRAVNVSGVAVIDSQANADTLSGIISGTGALSKVGTGSLTLSGVNTYSGGTQVNAGTVAISNDNNLGDAAGVLSVSNATVQTTANVVSGRAVNVSGVAVIDSQANADTLSGIISGTGALSKVGTGSLTLSGVNTYSGGTQVNAGTVAISNDNNLGDAAGVLSVSNATVQTTANVVSGRAVNVSGVAVIDSQANADTLSGIISGTGALSKVGTGSLTLSGVNTYSGGTQVNAGTVAISNDNNLGDAAGVLSVSNATVQTTANVVSGRAVNVSGVAVIDSQANADTLSGIISGTGALSKVGTGSLTLKGVNTYSGNTLVNSGSVIVSDNSSLGVNNNVVFQAGTSLKTASAVTLTQGITLAGNTLVDTGVNLSTLSGIISGTGALSKVGTGSLTLSGVNMYSGNTLVNNGSVIVSNNSSLGVNNKVVFQAGTSLKTASAVTLDQGVTLVGNTSIDTGLNVSTLNGVIGGSGALDKMGTGNLVLRGVNTYSGGTNINAGTLSVSNDNNLGSGALVLNGGTFESQAATTYSHNLNITALNGTIDTQSNIVGVSGIVSGVGALTKTGLGTLRLSGVNTYMGGTFINSGAIAVSDDNALGDASSLLTLATSSLMLDANVAIARNIAITGQGSINTVANTVSLNGVISGSGSLAKQGSGTLTLSGNNTYTGGTIITEGNVAIATQSNLGTGALTIQGGTLVTTAAIDVSSAIHLSGQQSGIDTQGNAVSLSGVIDGAGALLKSGSGNLTLSGKNTYTGGTQLLGGTLTVGSDANLGTGNVTVQGGTLSLLDGFSSTKTLTKNSVDMMLLNGSASFGSIVVNQGELRVNGILTSPFSVGSGGTLRGTGTINGNVSVAGIVSPGNSPGVMTINGDMAILSTGSYTPEIDGSTAGNGTDKYSQLLVSGTFVANGTLAPALRGLAPSATNSFTPVIGQSFKVVEASAINGTFATYTAPATGLAAGTRLDVGYSPKAITLFVTPSSYVNVAVGSNNQDVAAILEAFRPAVGTVSSSSDLSQFYQSLLAADTQGINQVLSDINPSVYAESANSIKSLQQYLHNTQTLTDHFSKGGLAIKGIHQKTDVDAENNGFAATRNWNGVQVDIDTEPFPQDWQAGITLTSVSNSTVESRASKINISGYDIALSARKTVGQLRMAVGINGGQYDISGTRNILVGGSVFRTAMEGAMAYAYGVNANAVYAMNDDWQLSSGLLYSSIRQSSFAETGNATLGLSVDSTQQNQTVAMLGANWTHAWKLSDWRVMPKLAMQLEQGLSDNPSMVKAKLIGKYLSAESSDTGGTLFRGLAGVSFIDSNGLMIGIDAATEKGKNQSGYSGQLKLSKSF